MLHVSRGIASFLRRVFWLASDAIRVLSETAFRAELDAYRTARLPPSEHRLLRIIWDGFLCQLLRGSVPQRLASLVNCASQHLLNKLLINGRNTAVTLTSFSVNFPVYDLAPESVLRIEGLFAYNPFIDELRFPACYDDVLSAISKGCCLGMCISYTLYSLHGSSSFIESAAYGVPGLAQQIQLFVRFPVVWSNLSPRLWILSIDEINRQLRIIFLKVSSIRGPLKVESLVGCDLSEGTYLVHWTKEDPTAAGHASVLVIETNQVTFYEPNIGEMSCLRKRFTFSTLPIAFADYAYFSLLTMCSTAAGSSHRDQRKLQNLLKQGYISKDYSALSK